MNVLSGQERRALTGYVDIWIGISSLRFRRMTCGFSRSCNSGWGCTEAASA
jgi:hypothetical protein